MRLCEYSWKVLPTAHPKHTHLSGAHGNKTCRGGLKHPSDEAALNVDWLDVQRQRCDGDSDGKHHYLLMKPVSRSNQARREEGGQCPREDKREEVTQLKGQTDESRRRNLKNSLVSPEGL